MRYLIGLTSLIFFSGFANANIIIIEQNRIFLVKSELNNSMTTYDADILKKQTYFKLNLGNKDDHESITIVEAESQIPDFRLFEKPKSFKPASDPDCGGNPFLDWQVEAQWIGELTDKEQKWNFYVLIPEGYKLTRNVKRQKSTDLKTTEIEKKPDPIQDSIDAAAAKASGYTTAIFLDDTKNEIRYYSKDESLLGYYIYPDGTMQSLMLNLKVGKKRWRLLKQITVTNHCA